MEKYTVYGELKLDVSKVIMSEGDQEAFIKADEYLNSNSEIVSIVLKDINGNEFEFNMESRNLHNLDVSWDKVFDENE